MEENKQITLDEWVQWKEDIRRKLEETADNFVYIGYRLKQIRDSGMYDGAADIFEFAEKEYGLGKSTVSRFIAINEKYSKDGNSIELKEEFRGFSSSKLSEMLTLPDNEIQLITEKTTIREIRELKSFNIQDLTITENEEMDPLGKCIVDYFRTRKEMLNSIIEHLRAEPPEYKQAAEIMAPSGQASHKKGIVFLFLYDWNTGIKYKLMTEPDPVAMSWTSFLGQIYCIFGACDQTDVWSGFYGEGELEKEPEENPDSIQSNQGSESVATSQQKEENQEEKTEKPVKQPEALSEKRINTKSEMPSPPTEPQEEPVEQQKTAPETDVPQEMPITNEEKEPDEEESTGEDREDDIQDPDKVQDAGEQTEAGSYEEIIEQLIEDAAFKSFRISEELNEGRKELNEYIKIRGMVNNLSDNLRQIVKYINLSTLKEKEEEEENEDEE